MALHCTGMTNHKIRPEGERCAHAHDTACPTLTRAHYPRAALHARFLNGGTHNAEVNTSEAAPVQIYGPSRELAQVILVRRGTLRLRISHVPAVRIGVAEFFRSEFRL